LFDELQEAPPVLAIEGFHYQPDWIELALVQSLITHIDEQPWDTAWQRRIQQYGLSYTKNRQAQPIQLWLTPLCERLVDERIMSSHPTQIFANEYTSRIGIAPHSDYSSSGKIIAGLSLGSPVIMDFIGPEQQKLSQLLEHRNLYSIFGPARYKRKHGIASRKGAKYLGGVHRAQTQALFYLSDCHTR
jgi:alkylated DNA repair dioxygenase AlkB